ncbi:MAG: lysophospholipid acyltransferase family protein, partial [Chitinivibrionia bacterium]|nr:lysophospholipid acyltransferase family protein [Chitinivibrionia bacterium]
MPSAILHGLGMAGGSIHCILAAEKRRNYRRNISYVERTGARRVTARRAFQNPALNILDMLKAISEPAGAVGGGIAFDGLHHLDAARERGTGLILATCHLGNWELSGIALSARGYPITTVAGRQLTDAWSNQVKEWKRRFGIRVVSPGSGYRTLYRDLASNRILVLHVDGDLFAGGVEADFLGEAAMFPRGPARIARAMRSPVAFAYCRRRPKGRFEVTIQPPFLPPADAQEEIALTRTLVKNVEKCVLAEPEQWCIFRSIRAGM